jgi:DNA-nicking Smr family endonuclease
MEGVSGQRPALERTPGALGVGDRLSRGGRFRTIRIEFETMSGEEPFELPIDGVLDLHAFRSEEVKSLVPEYLGECRRRGLLQVRIIHGKGTGALRRLVQSLLSKDPAVLSFKTADLSGGGWGATEVVLKPLEPGPKE